ncbi:MAG: B12-binding domain-containing radical SAM protein [Dehalococcoidia bacterium]
MKISIISVNRERIPDPLLPIGPALVAATLRAEGHDVRILDLCHQSEPAAAILSHLTAWQPELVGISLRLLENNQMMAERCYLDDAAGVVEQVRSVSSCPMVLGGAAYSLYPAEVLQALDVPYGLAGEAECSLADLVRCIEIGQPPTTVPGACYRAGRRVIVNGLAKVHRFPGLPIPAYDLVDCHKYIGENAVLPVESKRGCDLACSFCPESADKEGARLKPASLTVDEIEQLTKQVGTNRLFFTDGVFQYPPEHAMAVCQEMIRRQLDAHWLAGINPAGLSRRLLAAMREAGCVGVALGLDAVTDGMLKSYNKGFTQADIAQTLADLRAVGMPFAIYVLFGGPGETLDSVRDALNFLDTVARDKTVFIGMGIRVYKGTALERTARQEGFIKPRHNMLQPTYYLSRELDESLLDRLEEYCQARPGWFTDASLMAALPQR